MPGSRQVQRLEQRGLVDGAVAKDGHGDLAGLVQLGTQGRTDGNRCTRTDDGIFAQQPDTEIGVVHRAALALAATGAPAQQLGHALLWVQPLGDGLSVAAVGAGQVVVAAQWKDRADGGGFLADAGVQRAAQLTAEEEGDGLLLEAADQQHRAVHAAQVGRR